MGSAAESEEEGHCRDAAQTGYSKMKRLFLAVLLALFGISTYAHDFAFYPPHAPEPRLEDAADPYPQVNTFCAANLACTITGIWTFTGVPIFPNGATVTGAVTATNIDNELHVCASPATAYTTVEAALAALPTNGGKVIVCPGFRETFTTAPITVGSATQGVLLDLTGADINITCNSTAGASTWCWLLGAGGKIVGNGPQGPTPTTGSSTLSLASTANVAGLISPAVKTSAQEYFEVENVVLTGSCSATIGTALVDLEGVFDGSEVSGNLIYIANAPLLRVAANASTSLGQLFFKKNFINGGGCTNAQPIVITGTATTFAQSLYFAAGSIANAGPSQPAIQINGNGNTGCNNISFFGMYIESDQTGPTNEVTVRDCSNVKFDSIQLFGSGVNAPTNGFNWSQSATGLTHDIQLISVRSNASKLVNNSITGQSFVGPNMTRYVYGGNSTGPGFPAVDLAEAADTGFDYGIDGANANWFVSANRQFTTGTIYNGANPAYVFTMNAANGPTMTIYNGLANGNSFLVDSQASLRIGKGLVADAVNTIDIGNSATGVKLPFRNIYFGPSATSYHELISSATAARTATYPDASFTLAGVNIPQTFTAAQTLGSGSSLNLANLFLSPTAPTIAAGGCGGSAAAIQNANGTASFEIFTGTAPTSSGCTVTFPAAAHHWICPTITHTSAVSTTNFIILQTGALSTTSVTFQLFSDVAAATAPAASDTWAVSGCHAN
jgi:hypothetical protein